MIYLDSADEADVRVAADLGLISGITTNPTLMATCGDSAVRQLERLLECFPGPIFYQVHTLDLDGAFAEANRARSLDPDRVVLKLPAVREHFRLAARLSREGIRFAVTAVYAPAQALLAAQAGAEWIIPYVDRARRLQEGGEELTSLLSRALTAPDGRRLPTRIMAASLKTPAQAVGALADGADAVTLPLTVIEAMITDPLTERAVAEFSAVTR
jgi:transaldolase